MTQLEKKKAAWRIPDLQLNALTRSDPWLWHITHWPELLTGPHPTAGGEEVPSYLSLDGRELLTLSTKTSHWLQPLQGKMQAYEHCIRKTSFKKKKFCLILFLSERQSTSGEGQREGDPESEAGPRLRAVSAEPNAGLEPTNREIVT